MVVATLLGSLDLAEERGFREDRVEVTGGREYRWR
jgi:hypothetical protein